MNSRMRYLSSSTVVQPLIHRWYAIPYVVAPHTGALNLTKRFLPAIRNYLTAPEMHASALNEPSMFGGPFIDAGEAGPEGVEVLLEQTLKEGLPRIQLAEDIDTARAMLADHGNGRALGSLYERLPDSLRGVTELVYDSANHPSLRFFEPLLYRTAAAATESQIVSLVQRHVPGQAFVYSSPIMPGTGRTDIPIPFRDTALDALFAGRLTSVDVDELTERFELAGPARESFGRLFVDEPPRPYQWAAPGEVRARFFGHACVLLELDGFTVMTDPTLGYDGDGYQHFTISDLPERLNVVVLSHAHSDHFSFETLLQLRERIDTIVVPKSSGGSLLDISPQVMLEQLGFRNVVELGDTQSITIGPVELTALPFLGEHGDLDIRAKMVPMVRLGGRGFLFATDTSVVDPLVYDLVAREIGTIDAMFIGLECLGAPMSWLYGPLMDKPVTRQQDIDRSLKGSDAASADRLARQLGARQVFVYALGIEPWLKHLTGSWLDPDDERQRQTRLLTEICADRGVRSELIYITDERSWPAGTAPSIALPK